MTTELKTAMCFICSPSSGYWTAHKTVGVTGDFYGLPRIVIDPIMANLTVKILKLKFNKLKIFKLLRQHIFFVHWILVGQGI